MNIEQDKKPKKPAIFYWCIALVVFLLLNVFVFPNLFRKPVTEVGYDTFMDMTYKKDIGYVNVESNQIVFTNKENTEIYKTGKLNDPDLVSRLYDSGAEFTTEIVQETSLLTYVIFSYVVPIVLFILLWRFLSKKVLSKMGGGDGNSMMFGMGRKAEDC